MNKVAGFVIGAVEVGIGIATGNPALIVQGALTIAMQAIVDLTASKQPARDASEMTIKIGEQPRVARIGETYTPGIMVDGFDYGGKYGTDWEVMVIRLADHKSLSLTGFYVNDDYNPYSGDGLVGRYNGQLEIHFRADTSSEPLPAIVTANGPGWSAADIGRSGCDVIIAYKADAPDAKHPVWPGGRPHFGFVLKGKLQYDLRKDDTVAGGSGPHRWTDPSTWEWSENAIVCWYNFERGIFAEDDVADPTRLLVGRGLSIDELPPVDEIIAAANLCDELDGTQYPGRWTATDCFGRALSADTTTLYSVHGDNFATFYLPTRSQLLSSTLDVGCTVGAPIAVTAENVFIANQTLGVFSIDPNTGEEARVVAPADMHMFAGGIAYAGGDLWVFPDPFDPLCIGRVVGTSVVRSDVNFNASQVFTNSAGVAIALGTTTGHVLAIGPAGADATLIDTTAQGTSGSAYGFDPNDGAHYIVRQGNYLFFIDKVALTIATAIDTGGTPAGLYDSFVATRVGAAAFWNGASEFKSSDLSLIRTINTALFDPVPELGGFETVGYFYDPINNALLSATNAQPGIIARLLDRNGGYRVAGPIYANQPYIDVEEMFQRATAGSIVTRAGATLVEPGQAKSIVATFTDADLVAGSTVSWNQGFLSEASDEWLNTLIGTYVEPDQKWNSHATPPVRSEADIIADGEPREGQLPLRLVRYAPQALRICEIARRLGRLWGRGVVTLNKDFCRLEDGDWVQWQSDRFFAGGTKTLRIESYQRDKNWQVTAQLREMSAEAFAADGVFSPDLSGPTTTPPPPSIGSPAAANWTLSPVSLESAGASIPALELTGSASDDPYVEAIIVEYWLYDGVTDPTINPDAIPWITDGRYAPGMTKDDIRSVTGHATYYVAVTYVVDGILGDRLVLGPVTVADYSTLPSPISESAVAGDTESATITRGGALSESAAAADAESASLTDSGTLNEGAAAADAESATVVGGPGTLGESTAAADAVSATVVSGATLAESAAAGDAESGTVISGVTGVRASRMDYIASNGLSITVALPSGSQAGDLCFFMISHGFDISFPAGWVPLSALRQTNLKGAIAHKVLTAGDITTGTITIGLTGSFTGEVFGLTMVGSLGVQSVVASNDNSGASSRTLNTDANPAAGDYLILFGAIDVNAAVTSASLATLLQTNSNTGASGLAKYDIASAGGAQSATINYGGAPTGDYQALLAIKSVAVSTLYTNAGGTGNRSSSITVTSTNITAGGGSPGDTVDGSQANSYWWVNATGNGTGWLTFDFGVGVSKVIDQILLYQDATNTHGIWRFEGSPDNVTWTQCGADFTLQGLSVAAGVTNGGAIPVPNTTAYRYYRLRHMSGTRSQTPFIREFEFKIA